jgi:hypothetical protein
MRKKFTKIKIMKDESFNLQRTNFMGSSSHIIDMGFTKVFGVVTW